MDGVKVKGTKIKPGDVVKVTRRESSYFGQLGVVKSLTEGNVSARLALEDGRMPTLRVGSLKVVSMTIEVRPSTALKLTAELRRVQKEVAEMRAMLTRIEKLLLSDEDGWVDA